MQTWKAELLYPSELILGEGAFWHHERERFLFVDIEGGVVGSIDPVKKTIKEQRVGKRVGTVVPASNGKLILALQGSIEEMDFETGERRVLTEIEPDKPDNRSNDGKCDVEGRLWIGTMHVNAQPMEGALYCYDGSLRKKINGRSISNGICWSNDNRRMYYIDSPDYQVRAYDFDPSSGEISHEEVIIQIAKSEGSPDGMCIDAEGKLWIALWGGGCINRYDPVNGSLIGRVTVAAPHVTSCVFGGKHLDRLFITTAKAEVNEEQLQQYPLSGGLFIADTGIKGTPGHFFKTKP